MSILTIRECLPTLYDESKISPEVRLAILNAILRIIEHNSITLETKLTEEILKELKLETLALLGYDPLFSDFISSQVDALNVFR